MKIPLSWLKEFVDVELPAEEIARLLTLAGMEVEEIRYVGLPLPEGGLGSRPGTKVSGLAWDPDKIVVGAILEVLPHPNADRLVLCRLDGGDGEHVVLTGAPNLFPYKGQGPLSTPLKVAYAREGTRLYDGHQAGRVIMTLERAKIRGVESYSMACSEKELGISDDHEGVILLDDEAPLGRPLADYMGDVVLDMTLTPNVARNANVLGVARELAALAGGELKEPSYEVPWTGAPIEGRVKLEITNPELNPRFVLGLIEDVKIGPSPYWVQLRLRLSGMRPISNIVDATNYVMLEIGEPLHAFDYDVLLDRAGGDPPTILTRCAGKGERLTTLDGEERILEDFTVLVADSAGALSIAGIMGGGESEVSIGTTRVLLEGAAWNFINIRRTQAYLRLESEAAYRFSRGVHPAMAESGVRRCLRMMSSTTGGTIAQGLVDAYPLPPKDPTVEVTPEDARRWLGVDLSAVEMADMLERLGFGVEVGGETLLAKTPDHRLDIGEGVVGKADLMEEIARVYGYDRIPETLLADELPELMGDPRLEREERTRDLLVDLGLQEVVTYRLTSPEREARVAPPGGRAVDHSYVEIHNPIASDRTVMRQSLLASVLEVVERNARVRDRIGIFEIGSIFLTTEEAEVPQEPLRLVIAMTGPRSLPSWQHADEDLVDFFDLKGILDSLLMALHVGRVGYQEHEHPSFHPGKCAQVLIGERSVGLLGELHPLVHENFEFGDAPVVVADLDLEAVLQAVAELRELDEIAVFPPVLEDLAVVIDEGVAADKVESVIRESGGDLVVEVRLFDLFRGEQVGKGKKSLAYSVVYQAPDRTLTDAEVAEVRARIVEALEKNLGGSLRA